MAPEDQVATEDEYLWLEEVEGEAALDWVRSRNATSEAELFTDPRFESLRSDILSLLEADDRIPMPSLPHDVVLNFWTDSRRRRGVLKRAPASTTSWAARRVNRGCTTAGSPVGPTGAGRCSICLGAAPTRR